MEKTVVKFEGKIININYEGVFQGSVETWLYYEGFKPVAIVMCEYDRRFYEIDIQCLTYISG